MAADIISQIDEQIAFLHCCRSVFPRLSSELAGHTHFETARYYQQQGFRISFHLSEPATEEFIDDFNKLAHWINENFVLRLYAILDSHQLFENLKRDSNLAGHNEMEILRLLRNAIGHGSGNYNPEDAKKRQLFDRIVQHFGLSTQSAGPSATKYPLPIDQVLIPMAQGCRSFAVARSKAATGPE